MVAPVLIFAIGNESRGDDALGPLLLRELDILLTGTDEFELLEDFQLQIEHAIDLKDRRLVLFIDAGINMCAPFAFYRARANDAPVLYSHALAPEALLKVFAQYYQEALSDVFILCIKGERFELGEGLSHSALTNLRSAFEFCTQLLAKPEVVAWDNQISLLM